MPDWLLIAVAVATPLLGFGGAALGQMVSRRNANELERRWRREETLRTLRWAADRATDVDSGRSALGAVALVQLVDAELVEDVDKAYIRAILNAVKDGSEYAESSDESEVGE